MKACDFKMMGDVVMHSRQIYRWQMASGHDPRCQGNSGSVEQIIGQIVLTCKYHR